MQRPDGAKSQVNGAVDAAFVEAIYHRLRWLARRKLQREPHSPTIQATALVHEAWLRLEGGKTTAWEGRAHFYNAAALAMRRILVDRARRKQCAKRGGEIDHVPIELADSVAEGELDILKLDEVLERLEVMDSRAHEIVHLRFFVGLSVEETARVTGLSARTVKREWSTARLWLYDQLSDRGDLRREA